MAFATSCPQPPPVVLPRLRDMFPEHLTPREIAVPQGTVITEPSETAAQRSHFIPSAPRQPLHPSFSFDVLKSHPRGVSLYHIASSNPQSRAGRRRIACTQPDVHSNYFRWNVSDSDRSRPTSGSSDEEVEIDDEEDDEESEEGMSFEEKRHVCPNCSKRFNRPSSLRIHVNTHTGATPFRCPYPSCGRAFNVNSNMRRHFRNHGPSVFTSKPALSADNSATLSPSTTVEVDSKPPILPTSSIYRSVPPSPSPFCRSTSSPITPTSPSTKFSPSAVPIPFQRCPAQWGIAQSSMLSDEKLHLNRETESALRGYSESDVRSERRLTAS